MNSLSVAGDEILIWNADLLAHPSLESSVSIERNGIG